MALTATIYHLRIAVSDVERGVYEALDLRVARHPSETMRYLLTRVLGYCLFYEEGLAFSRGLSTAEEPALWKKDGQGGTPLWIEVGKPSAERLHKASKASGRLVVLVHYDPEMLLRELRGKTIHKADRIEVVAFPPAFLDELDQATDRNAQWELVYTGGELYVTSGGKSMNGAVTRSWLVEPA